MKYIKNIRMEVHRKNHILFKVVFECPKTEDLEEFSVAMGYSNDWTSNVKTPNNHCIDINSMDVNVVKKFCVLVANGVITDNSECSYFDEDTINVLNVPTEKEGK